MNMNHFKDNAEYELGLIFQQPSGPIPANLLNYPSFFEMGQTARNKLDAAKNAQKRHRLNNYVPSYSTSKTTIQKKDIVYSHRVNGAVDRNDNL